MGPLLALADLAGGYWPDRARSAALQLSATDEDAARASLGALVLRHVRDVFEQRGTDRLPTEQLLRV